jgi:hypothetical protein
MMTASTSPLPVCSSDIRQFHVRKVGRNLEQDGQAARQGEACGVDARKKADQFIAGLQATQARCVGRGDVDGEVGGARPEPAHAFGVVRHAVFGVLVGADVDANNTALAAARIQPAGHSGSAIVIEAHAVDHRLVFHQAEQARARIAFLWPRRHCPHFHKAKALGQHLVGHFGILVKPRRKAQRIGKVDDRKGFGAGQPWRGSPRCTAGAAQSALMVRRWARSASMR